VYLDLDAAWEPGILELATRDARAWGPRLRCFAPRRAIKAFIAEVVPHLPAFVLYGSGDFHHLTAALLRGVRSDAFHLVAFDNHPDWDRRPPHWACGGWMNRAFDLPNLRRATVWGCGNFELNWPNRIFGNHDVEVFGWRERYPERGRITRGNWMEAFAAFAESLRSRDVYITVDMDCLREDDAITNWENGLFSAEDVAWAITLIRERANVIGGDICGAYSKPVYARPLQRFAAEWDHPKRPPTQMEQARAINARSAATIWNALSPTR
jgi:arginase family enzyme